MSAAQAETYGSRLRQYERREQMTIWVAAGVAALVAFIGANALQDRPAVLSQLVLSVVIISGAALAFARVQFEWAATVIRRDLEDQKIRKDDPLGDSDKGWPSGAERFWTTSLVSLATGWAVMFIGIWWPQISRVIRCLTDG